MRRGPVGVSVGAVVALVAVVALGAACSSTPAPSTTAAGVSTTEAPKPAGREPSEISKMVCAAKAQHEIDEVLGLRSVVTTPTWVNHVYSCVYRYPGGSFGLSVKELDSYPETRAYFAGLGVRGGVAATLPNLGQAALQTSDGSVAVRKDYKVLFVDDSGLPSQFGVPATSRGDVAITVADVILGCWDGD